MKTFKENLIKFLTPYLVMLVSLGVLEYFWFLHVINGFVTEKLSHVMADDIKYIGVALFYIFYPIAVYYFAIKDATSIKKSAITGAIFGFSVYFVYEATNYAIIFDWPLSFSIIDVIWGAVITGVIASIGFRFKKK